MEGLTKETPLLIRLILSTGLVSDRRRAEYVLYVFVGLCVCYMLSGLFRPDPIPPQHMQQNPNYEPPRT